MLIRAGVADDATACALVETAVREFGRLDCLVNNAATSCFTAHADLGAVADEAWDELHGVNYNGTFHAARTAIPHQKRSQGSIASVAGIAASGSSTAYARRPRGPSSP